MTESAHTRFSLGPELLAGSFSFMLILLNCLTFSSLIFKGVLGPWMGTGLTLFLMASIVIQVGVGLGTSFRGIVAGPQETPMILLSTVSAAILATQAAGKSPETLFASIVVLGGLCSFLAGAFFLVIGRLKLGHVMDYLPYPVMCGFFAGIGFLLAKNALLILSEPSFHRIDLSLLGNPAFQVRIAPALVFTVLLIGIPALFRKPALFPLVVALGFAGFYAALPLLGLSVGEAQTAGLMFGPFNQGSAMLNPFEVVRAVDWHIVLSNAGIAFVILLISSSNLLLNTAGLGLHFNKDIDVNREMQVAGLTNMVTAFVGGAVGYQYFSTSIINHQIGSRSRATAVVIGILCVPAMFFGTTLAEHFPRFVVGAILLSLGFRFLWDWLWKIRTRISAVEHATVVLIFACITALGVLQGVTVGILVASVIFVFQYSRTNIVKHELNLATTKSNVEHDEASRELIVRHGDEAYVLHLQSFIFFGTSYRLLEKIRRRLAREDLPPLRFLVVDFRMVKGIDSSFTLRFNQMRLLLANKAVELVVTSLPPAIAAILENADCLTAPGLVRFDHVNDGIALVEGRLLTEHAAPAGTGTIADMLALIFTDRDSMACFADCLERKEFAAGDVFFRMGAPGDDLYLVESGQAAITVPTGNGDIKLSTVTSGTVIGEIAFFNGFMRTATVTAEKSGVAYRLGADSWQRLKAAHPTVAMRFYDFAISLLSRRLISANREVRALLS